MFFALLRLSLHASTPDNPSAFLRADEADWEQVFSLAARQGTVLLTYGGLQHLPAGAQPPRKLKLRWCANVIKGSERYDHYGRVVQELAQLFSQNGIDMLILKGVTISRLYPVPYYREGGDIDIYLFGEADRADRLVSSLGINVNHPIAKHSSFMLNGVRVENHRTFFDMDTRFRRESELYRKMGDMLDGLLSIEACPALNGENAVRQMSAQAAALYMTGHTFRHFCCLDINIKQLCDWTVFFTRRKDEIDARLLTAQIKELGLERFVTAINSFCALRLGFAPYFMVPGKNSEHTVLKTVLRYRLAPKVHIPVVGPLRYLIARNRIYNEFLGKISPSEFLLPEAGNYFSWLLKRIRRQGHQKHNVRRDAVKS